MARRALLHLGTPKSGTTYLQSLWWAQQAALREQGLLLPGRDEHEQFSASVVIRDNGPLLARMGERQLGAWDRIRAQAAAFDGDVLITQEQLVETSAKDAAAAVAALGECADEVHLVLTARDLARIVPSAWQQRVKHGSATTLARFCERVRADDPDFNFWRHQDLPRILERWAADVPAERVHVLPLPGPGAPRDLLWQRTCTLLGLDSAVLSSQAPLANDSLSPQEVEFLRRVNSEFEAAHHDVALSRRLRSVLGTHLGGGDSRPPALVLAPGMQAWLHERGNAMVDELAAGDWDVIGDLDDLRPAAVPPAGTDPDAVPADAVLDVSARVVADLVRATERAEPPAPRVEVSDGATGGRRGLPTPRWLRLPRLRR